MVHMTDQTGLPERLRTQSLLLELLIFGWIELGIGFNKWNPLNCKSLYTAQTTDQNSLPERLRTHFFFETEDALQELK